jgi:muconolactone delta-isomerase
MLLGATSKIMCPTIAQYLVTMDIEIANPLLPIEELTRVVRKAILPSLDALRDLQARGKVVTGGYPIGDRFMVFVVEADSEEHLREMLEDVPLYSMAKTKVRLLQRFDAL